MPNNKNVTFCEKVYITLKEIAFTPYTFQNSQLFIFQKFFQISFKLRKINIFFCNFTNTFHKCHLSNRTLFKICSDNLIQFFSIFILFFICLNIFCYKIIYRFHIKEFVIYLLLNLHIYFCN